MNCVLKERAQCYYTMLAQIDIKTLPRAMVMQLMITITFYINAFVWRQGVSKMLIPLTIVKVTIIDFNKHFHVIF